MNKRTRLTQAAKDLIHRQGYRSTTLADIAQEAEVPLGNVYYYFKTKDAIGEAIISDRQRELQALFQQWEQIPDPKQRLLAYLQFGEDISPDLARSGCPIGSLCQELEKHDGTLAEQAAGLLRLFLDWSESQFRHLGQGDESPDLALHLISSLQGASLLTNALGDPSVMRREAERLRRWIHAL